MSEIELSGDALAEEAGDEVPRTYRDLLRAAKLTRAEIGALHEIRDGRALLDFLGVAATTAAVPWLYLAFPNALVAVICVLLSIHNFNSFAQVVHGSDHGKFLSSGRWNDIVGALSAAMLGFTREGHALAHQVHHLKLNTDEDSDRIWGRPEQSTREMLRMWVQDIFMISAAKRLLQYMQFDRKSFTATPWRGLRPNFFAGKIGRVIPVVAAQAAIIAYYSAVIGPQYYIFFYVLPILTLYPAQIRLRTACEHCFDVGYQPHNVEERWISRSIRTNLLERLVIAPLLIQYHFEHHLLPGVPYYNLPLARRMLAKNGLEVPLAPGYFAFVYRRWRAERRLAAASEAV